MRMRDTIDPNADDDDWAFNVPRTVTLHLALDQNARAFLVREQQIVRPFEGQLRRQRWRFGDHGIAQRQSRNKGEFGRALDVSRSEYERLRDAGLAEEAPYALCLAFRIRYVLELDAREALHLIELRSGREGHPSYRAVAHEMRRAIAEVHPNVAAAMTFVDDSTEERLERILSEIRNEAKEA